MGGSGMHDDVHGKQVNQGQQTSRFYAIRAFYQAKSIFSKAFKDHFLIYISDLDLSLVDCEL